MSKYQSWKPEQKVDGKWYGNTLRFATKLEAVENGRDLFDRWTASQSYRAVQSTDPVNYRYVDGRAVAIVEEKNESP